ncbi:hypothetical protein SLS62_002689 [Diatrype stigma]|uniref:DUF676 domain-containing protein n=1 Tax=Diatrype stigma TaxID=117547 RepID=A0AAN9UTF6_9PEZI
MLLLHQVGSLKIGEVVRYTVTYTPSRDRILPSPEFLHLRIRNTSPIPLRAAFVHGPYTLSVAAYPAHFDPNVKFENPRRYGVPEHEPMLKAGGTWLCRLTVPDNIRESAGAGAARGDFADASESNNANGGGNNNNNNSEQSASWVVEITSQVIFSSSAAVGYEVMLARDEKSLSLNSVPVNSKNQAQVPQPGKVGDFQQSLGAKDGHHPAQPKGVFSGAITLKAEDTASLWNTPQLPGWRDWDYGRSKAEGEEPAVHSVTGDSQPQDAGEGEVPAATRKKPKRVHLVVLTHGLHSNLGADMLYMKERIDATVRQAKIDAKARRAREGQEKQEKHDQNKDSKLESETPSGETQDDKTISREEEEEYDDEEVIVRGFSGNATRTERGIKFLGKRLARFVLSMTYPDQPYLPITKKATGSIALPFRGEDPRDEASAANASHPSSTIHKAKQHEERAFQITSISFIGHSLGGLVQTYAIAYIQKHSPQFFSLIRPINFITLASPMLGLSNENPLYVKFALDFGLVGRTGQDLGLTWRAPTIARSGWGALVGTLGETAHKKVMGEVQPESKPLLRILPTGPAHVALKKFRNRTLYSNVVNDGIVPLRTSCLLFLDWQGLERVDKARREAGLVETVVGFGWAELTGANVSSRQGPWTPKAEVASETSTPPDAEHGDSHEVPLPPSNATVEDDRKSMSLARASYQGNEQSQNSQTNNDFPFSGFFNFFKSSESKTQAQKGPDISPRESKIYQRSQTLKLGDAAAAGAASPANSSKSRVTAGHELGEDHENGVPAPPRTTFFESAGDLLNPNLAPVEFLIDPSCRPRTIFHDRVYHPSDIPPPPFKKRTGSLANRYRSSNRDKAASSDQGGAAAASTSSSPYQSPGPSSTNRVNEDSPNTHTEHQQRGRDQQQKTEEDDDVVVDSSNMKVEEKIARAYHRDLSWRKVLVKLEPDAHNNIIVRRAFSNAYGWPVVKHLCDAHFSDSATTRTRDELTEGAERARPVAEGPDKTGAETKTQDEPRGTGDGGGEEGKRQQQPPKHSHKHTASEALEARDELSDLRSTMQERSNGGSGSSNAAAASSTTHPDYYSYDRADSGAWSDRDFADSGDESEFDYDLAYGHHFRHQVESPGADDNDEKKRKGKGKGKAKSKDSGRPGSPSWNWTEKIVGKGAISKKSKGGGPRSPTQQQGPPSPQSTKSKESAQNAHPITRSPQLASETPS